MTISKLAAIILHGMSLRWTLTSHYCYLQAGKKLRSSFGNAMLKLLYITEMVMEDWFCIYFALSTSVTYEDSVWDVWARTHSYILILYKGHNSSVVQCLRDRFGFLWIWELVLLRINRVSSLKFCSIQNVHSLELDFGCQTRKSAFVLCSVGCGQTVRFLHGQ